MCADASEIDAACVGAVLHAVEVLVDPEGIVVSHGHLENDLDVHDWAAPEFLEQAAEELLKEQWRKITTAKLPQATEMEVSTHRLG